MRLETENILATLKVISKGLRYPSESSYPYEPFVWDTQFQGEFNIIRVLENLEYFRKIEYETVIQDIQNVFQRCKYHKNFDEIEQIHRHALQIIETLKVHVTKIEVFTIAHPISYPKIIIGRTKEGEWAGISTTFDYQTCSFGELLEIRTYPLTNPAIYLKNIIDPLLEEQRYSVYDGISNLVFETAPTKDDLILRLLISAGYIEIWKHKSFEEQKNNLDLFLLERLQDVLTYVFCYGDGFSIYTIGETTENDFIGVSTIGIWT
jgi:Nuclease A inhibitor-like protein